MAMSFETLLVRLLFYNELYLKSHLIMLASYYSLVYLTLDPLPLSVRVSPGLRYFNPTVNIL